MIAESDAVDLYEQLAALTEQEEVKKEVEVMLE